MQKKNEAEKSPEQIYQELRCRDAATLLKELEVLTEAAEINGPLITAYLTVLEEKSPVLPSDFSPEKDLQDFKEKYAKVFEDSSIPISKSRRRRRFKPARTIAVAMLTLFLLAVCAEAFGVPVRKYAYQWGSDAYMILAWGPSGRMTQTLKMGASDEYASLEGALAAYDVQDPVLPRWIPNEFTVNSVTAKIVENDVLIKAVYQADRGRELIIRVVLLNNDRGEAAYFEHELDDGTYVKDGTSYVITENNEQVRTSWSTERCSCSINGEISVELMKRIINSIGKG